MRLRYFIAVLCCFLIVALSGFFVVFDKFHGFPGQRVEEIPAAAVNPAGEGEGIPEFQSFLVYSVNEGDDLILASYHDPLYQEGVLSFFQDLSGSREVATAILDNATANNIPLALAFALCEEESHYNPRAFNRNRNDTVDRGLFQLNNATFPKLKAEDFYDAETNARHGLAHLRWCLDNAGSEVAGLAMYNAGTTRVRSAGTPKDTLDYISRILNRQQKIEKLFITGYSRLVQSTDGEEKPGKTQFRLTLLTPLGR